MSLHVLIANDHALVSEGLKVMLSTEEDVDRASTVSTDEAAIDAARQGDVDVVLMDINLSQPLSGIEATRQIKKISPSTRVLILSMLTDPGTVSESIKAGADGYLSKSASPESVIQAIHDVAAGRAVLDPSVTDSIFGRIGGNTPDVLTERKTGEKGADELTDREEKVQKGMADGLSTKEIAARLNLPEETVKTNLRSLRQKLGVRYWTDVNPKYILKGFWHRIRKGK